MIMNTKNSTFYKTLQISTIFISLFLIVTVAGAGSVPLQDGIRRFRDIKEWQAKFHYELDYEDSYQDGSTEFLGFKGLGGEDIEKVIISGTATYTYAGRGVFVGKGSANYEVSIMSMASMGNAWVVYLTDGKGKDNLEPIKEINYLRIDLSEGTYDFWVTPGHDDEEMAMFGVDVVSRDYLNITEPMIKKMAENGTPVMFPELLKAMFPNQRSQADLHQLNAYVNYYPLPSFGYVLSGSFTDELGGIFSWELRPSKPLDLFVGEETSIASGHFHPPDEETRQWYTSMRREAEDAVRGTESFPEPQALSLASFKIFLVSETRASAERDGIYLAERDVTITQNSVSRDSNTGKFLSKLIGQRSSAPMIVLTDEQILTKTIQTLRHPGPRFEKGELINALSEIHLEIDRIELNGTTAIISGSPTGLKEISPLQIERAKAQIKETASQFSFVGKVDVRISNKPLAGAQR